MSGQNRFLLPHSGATVSTPAAGGPKSSSTNAAASSSVASSKQSCEKHESELSVDTDFDLYWEEEARNPQRNRIRIGRQYQATVPALLKPGEIDQRHCADLETLTFCPKRSAKVSDAELEHYFKVAKSLNLFASLAETRSLLGRDVTIADINHIRNKEGLSLASVIQPARQTANHSQSAHNQATLVKSPQSSSQSPNTKPTSSNSSENKTQASAKQQVDMEISAPTNRPLIKALSHFISLHHPCHHDEKCKKLGKDSFFLEEEEEEALAAGNLRQITSGTINPTKCRSRISVKQPQASAKQQAANDNTTNDNTTTNQSQETSPAESPPQPISFEDWTREEVELFSKAIEVCGKNFGSVKKEFLPSKSVRSIVEYYYIGSRDTTDSKRQKTSNQSAESEESSDKSQASPPVGLGATTVASSSAEDAGMSSSNKQISCKISEVKSIEVPSLQQNHSTTTTSQQARKSSQSKAKSSGPKSIDARMSVYNFDDEFREEVPAKMEVASVAQQAAGAEVKPLKAKPMPTFNAASEGESVNPNVGSLNFFMDGQLVLKLDACQEDAKEGSANDKCLWVQGSEQQASAQSRQKRSHKRGAGSARVATEPRVNSAPAATVASNGELVPAKDHLGSAYDLSPTNTHPSSIQKPKKQTSSSRRAKPDKSSDAKPKNSRPMAPTNITSSPIDYNLQALNGNCSNNSIRDFRPSEASQLNASGLSQLINPAAMIAPNGASSAGSVPMTNWFHANQLAMAAAILGGFPFPAAAAAAAAAAASAGGNAVGGVPAGPREINGMVNHQFANHLNIGESNNHLATSRPMDLSLEHTAPKPLVSKPSSRSRSKQRN